MRVALYILATLTRALKGARGGIVCSAYPHNHSKEPQASHSQAVVLCVALSTQPRSLAPYRRSWRHSPHTASKRFMRVHSQAVAWHSTCHAHSRLKRRSWRHSPHNHSKEPQASHSQAVVRLWSFEWLRGSFFSKKIPVVSATGQKLFNKKTGILIKTR